MAEPTQSLPEEGLQTVEEQEDPSIFLSKAQSAGLTPEEIASEFKVRYNVDISTPVVKPLRALEETVGKAFRGSAPKGMRPKTVAEEVMEPIATTSGIVGGAVEGMADLFGPNITEAMLAGTGMGKVVSEPQRQTVGKELRDIRKDIDKTFLEREGQSGFENLRQDLTDNAEGILEIINVVRGAEDFTAEHKSTVEHLFGKQKEGSVTGRQFTLGMAADIWSLGDDPIEYATSRPFTFATMIAGPLAEVNALAKAGYQPAINLVKSKSGQALKNISDKASSKLSQYEKGVKVKQAADKTKRNVKEGLQSVRRWVEDPFVQQTEKASRLTEALVDTANRTGKSVQQIATRWAESVKRGYEDVTPESSSGVKIPVETAEKVVGPRKAQERWDTPDTVKVFTQEVDYNPTTAHFGGKREAAAVYAEALEAYKAGKLTREQYDGFVKYIRKQEAKPESITIANTHWKEATGRFLDDLAKLEHVDPAAVMLQLNKTLSDKSVGMLRSQNVRKQVAQSIVDDVRDLGIYTPEQLVNLEQKLPTYLDEINKRDPSSPSYQANPIINFDGYRINVGQKVIDIVDSSPKLRKHIYAELISEAAGDIAQDTRLNVISESLKENMPMALTEAEWIDNALERAIISGEELAPMIQDNPHHLATRMIDNLDGYARIIARSDDPRMLAQAKKQIRDLAHKIRSYKRVPEEITEAFGIQDHIRQNKPLQPPETKAGKAPAKLAYEVFAPAGVIDTLKWELASKNAVQNATGFWQTLNRQIKANLTARNIASAINNLKANFVYQTFRRGTPLLTSNLTDIMRKYHGYRTGKALGGEMQYKLSPYERKFFEAGERSGMLDTTMLDAEIGIVGKEKSALIGKLAKGTTRKLEKFYRAGDNIFKLEEAKHNFDKLTKAMDKLEEGDFISFEVKPGQNVKLYKRGGNFDLDGKILSPSQLDDVVFSASSLPAQRIFFDYTNVPNAVKWVRASKALGITSPFFTWFWKAIDIPGVKRGLLREALTDGVTYATNNKKINAQRRLAMGANIAKRQAMMAGLREAVKAPENSETLRKVLAYSPKDFNLQLLDYTTNPMWIGHDSEESSNQFGPSDLVIRAIMSGMAMSEDDQEIVEQLYPEEHGRFGKQIDFDLSSIEDPEIRKDILIRRKLLKKHHSKEGFTAADAAQLIGVSGSPLLDGVIMLKEGSRQGGKFDKARLTKLVTTALLGGTAAALLDIGVAYAADPNSPSKLFTTRRWAENEIGEPEEKFIKWAMRRITGIGYRPLDVARRSDGYFKRKEFEWKNSITGGLRKLLKDNPDLEKQDRINMQKRINELEKIVEGEIMLEKLHFEEVYRNLRKNVRKK